MHKDLKEYLKKSLKGIWSPFFRRRIRREILDHLQDLSEQQQVSMTDAIRSLGNPCESNALYKGLMYKKLKSDSWFFGSLLVLLFMSTLIFIRIQVKNFKADRIGEFKKIEKKYKQEVLSLNYFKRSKERKNAAKFLDSVFDEKDKIIRKDFLVELHQFDYWDKWELSSKGRNRYFYEPISSKKILRLAKFAWHELRNSKNKQLARKDYEKVAQLIYSTESLLGYRIGNNMLDYNLIDNNGRFKQYENSRAFRASGVTMGLLNLNPHILEYEKSFRNVDYYQSGICHHAKSIWYFDTLYGNFLKSSWPLEIDWTDELNALESIKVKLKSDCRLSFANKASSPDSHMMGHPLIPGLPLTVRSFSFITAFLFYDTPYLRNIAGRLLVYFTSTQIQGNGGEVYASGDDYYRY